MDSIWIILLPLALSKTDSKKLIWDFKVLTPDHVPMRRVEIS